MKLWFGCKHKRLSPPRLRETATPDLKKDAVYVQSCMDCGKDLSYKPSAHEVKILESLEQRNLIQANEETTNFWGESGRRLLKLERLDKKYPQKVSSKSSSEHAPASNPKAYSYLAESIRAWPNQREFAEKMRANGWESPTWVNLTGGVVAVHTGIKGS